MNPIVARIQIRGFSLIEVLVALAVLSIGLLGLAALQTTGLKFSHQSYERTQATLQAYDIIDRIRTNKSGTGNTVNTTYDNVSLGSAPGTTDCATTSCDGTQLAEYDIRQWNNANAGMLAEGRGAICKGAFTNDANNNYPTGCNQSGSIYRIAITWKENDLYMRQDVDAQL